MTYEYIDFDNGHRRFFKVERIDKKSCGIGDGVYCYDYDIYIISEYEENYRNKGKFLCVDKSKSNDIFIYDVDKREIINIGNGDEKVGNIVYHFLGSSYHVVDKIEKDEYSRNENIYHNQKHYVTSLEDVVKEIFYNLVMVDKLKHPKDVLKDMIYKLATKDLIKEF